MGVIQKGLAVSWGVNGITATGVVITSASMMQNADFTRASKKAELLDADGEPAGLAYYDRNETFTISVVPAHATTVAGALVNQDAMLVAPGTVVTLTDTKSTITDPTPYLLTESRLRRTNTGASIVEMDMVRYENDITSTVT